MLISFSGLGGTGKTTHIGLLHDMIEEAGYTSRIVPLREYFWWTKVAAAVHGPVASLADGSRPSPRPVGPRGFKQFLRLIFYFFDSWRLYFFVLKPWKRSEVVIADRYFYDFFAELEFGQKEVSTFSRLLLALLPRPQLAFYFDLDPAQAQERKYEYPLPILEMQRNLYESIMAETPHVRVRVAEERHIVTDALRELVLAGLRHGTSSATAYTAHLYALHGRSHSTPIVPVIDANALLQAAVMNRMTWFFIRAFPGLSAVPRMQRIKEMGELLEQRRARTLDALAAFQKKTGVEARIVKDAGAVDQGTDVDVMVRSADDLRNVITYAEAQGWGVVRVGDDKADIRIPDALPLDVHVDTRYNGFLYITSDFVWHHPREAEALIIISHSMNELTLITLGDVLKVTLLEEQGMDWHVASAEARQNGWASMLDSWLRIYRDADFSGRRMPHRIAAVPLFFFKLRRYAHKLDGRPGKDFYDFLRALRARMMGKVPFHEPWVNA